MRPGTKIRWIALKNILESEIKKNTLTIDLGGFDGVISQKLKSLNPLMNIIVLDKDLNGLQLARVSGLNTICASALKIPLADNSSGTILCLDLIEHVMEDQTLVKEISRVLSNNGRMILTTPMKNGVSFPFLPKKYAEIINKKWGHVRKGYSIKELNKLFLKNNLKIIKQGRYFNYLSRFIYWLRYLTKYPTQPSELFFRFILKLEPFLKCKAEEHIIIAKKMIEDGL